MNPKQIYTCSHLGRVQLKYTVHTMSYNIQDKTHYTKVCTAVDHIKEVHVVQIKIKGKCVQCKNKIMQSLVTFSYIFNVALKLLLELFLSCGRIVQ